MTTPIRPKSGPRLGFALLTTFGLGFMRPASGTWGSLPPVVLVAILAAIGAGPGSMPWLHNVLMLLIAVGFTAVCVIWGDHAEARWGKDPSNVVADETAGQAIALLLTPAAFTASPTHLAGYLVAAFVLFRLLDIIKPWPAGVVQRIAGGWGVVLDDLIAGAMALAVLHIASVIIA